MPYRVLVSVKPVGRKTWTKYESARKTPYSKYEDAKREYKRLNYPKSGFKAKIVDVSKRKTKSPVRKKRSKSVWNMSMEEYFR